MATFLMTLDDLNPDFKGNAIISNIANTVLYVSSWKNQKSRSQLRLCRQLVGSEIITTTSQLDVNASVPSVLNA